MKRTDLIKSIFNQIKNLNLTTKKEEGNLLTFSTFRGQIMSAYILPNKDQDKNIFEAIRKFEDQHSNSFEMIHIKKFPIENVRQFRNMTLNRLSDITTHYLEPQPYIFLEEALYYMYNTGEKAFIPEQIEKYTQKNYAEYLAKLQAIGLQDIPRMPEFIEGAVQQNPKVLSYIDDTYKNEKLFDIVFKSCSSSILPYLKNNDKTFSICLKDAKKSDFYNELKNLPLNFTKQEITQLILTSVDSVSLLWKEKSLDVLYAEAFKRLPKEYLAKYDFSDSFTSKIDSYARTIAKMEINSKQAYEAMTFYVENRFAKDFDPVGADYEGRIVGAEYYVNQSLNNPANYFTSDKLSPAQWHCIVEINTNIINYIPEKVINNKEFWNNYESFIDRGNYPENPNFDYKRATFDQDIVFSKMPDNLKKDLRIMNDLLEKNIVSIKFFEHVPEDIYLKYGYKEYNNIPKELRTKENFRDCAIKAVNEESSFIQFVPESFLTQDMIEKVLLEDIRFVNDLPQGQGSVTRNIWNNISDKINEQIKDLAEHFNSSLSENSKIYKSKKDEILDIYNSLKIHFGECQSPNLKNELIL